MTDKEQEKIIFAADGFMPAGAWVAGGALTSAYSGKPINDVDLYFKDRESFECAVRRAYDESFWCVAQTSRAVTFVRNGYVIQLMHFRWFPDASDLFESFDFTCCMAAMDCESKEIFQHDDFLKHVSQRFLKFNDGTAYPFGTVARVLKYQKRGYTIGVNEMLRLALKCSDTRIESWDDLREQIGGQYGEEVGNLKCDGAFSIGAAISAMDGLNIAASSYGAEAMPGSAIELLAKVFGEK